MAAGRPQNILRPVKLTTYLPEDLRAQLDIHLYSEVEGRVPHGAYSKFLAERTREFFEDKRTAKEISKREAESTANMQKVLALEGLATELALTDLRSGLSAERAVALISRARVLTGKVPR